MNDALTRPYSKILGASVDRKLIRSLQFVYPIRESRAQRETNLGHAKGKIVNKHHGLYDPWAGECLSVSFTLSLYMAASPFVPVCLCMVSSLNVCHHHV